jgi:N-formylglutamate amidohydrolase
MSGAAQGDAPENKGLVAQINALAADKGVQLYIDVHSYSQLFMTRMSSSLPCVHIMSNRVPAYGYSCTARTPNNSILQTLASGAASAIRAVYGTTYQYGPVCQTIYQVAGGSIDYVQE